jgi:hypothetical protein
MKLETKCCTKCCKDKNINEFVNRHLSKDGLSSWCKECVKEYNKLNEDKLKILYKNNYEKNKERIKTRQKVNLKKILDQRKDRYHKDSEFRIRNVTRTRIWNALKNDKCSSSLDLLGCTIEEYKIYLEKQFLPEMNWENHGKVWEIDHKISLSSFDLTKTEQHKVAFHYTNTQPLFKTTEIAENFGYIDIIGNRNKEKFNIYDQTIIEILGFIPQVYGYYDLFNSNKTLLIHPNDLDSFKQLFTININNNYGNGELALYWLFKEQNMDFERFGINDLSLDGHPVEVKNYSKTKLIKIGKIPSSQNHNLIELQSIITKINKNYLVSQLNKSIINKIFTKRKRLDRFKSICKEIIQETLIKKIGNNGIIINFKSSELANIYIIDVNKFITDQILNHISFNEGYLHLELEKIFNDEIKQDTN